MIVNNYYLASDKWRRWRTCGHADDDDVDIKINKSFLFLLNSLWDICCDLSGVCVSRGDGEVMR